MANPRRQEMTQLGLLGLAPFVFGAATIWLSPWALPVDVALDIHRVVLAYGAAIVAYLSRDWRWRRPRSRRNESAVISALNAGRSGRLFRRHSRRNIWPLGRRRAAAGDYLPVADLFAVARFRLFRSRRASALVWGLAHALNILGGPFSRPHYRQAIHLGSLLTYCATDGSY